MNRNDPRVYSVSISKDKDLTSNHGKTPTRSKH